MRRWPGFAAAGVGVALVALWLRSGDQAPAQRAPASEPAPGGAATATPRAGSTGPPSEAPAAPAAPGRERSFASAGEAAPETAAPVAAVTGPPPRPGRAAAPPRPQAPAPPEAPGRQADGAAVTAALRRFSAADAALYGRLDKAGLESGPEVDALLALRRAGASAAELRAFVEQRFPPKAMLRALTLAWIDRELGNAAPADDSRGEAGERDRADGPATLPSLGHIETEPARTGR